MNPYHHQPLDAKKWVEPSKILLCNPAYFGVNYEINAWMDKQNQPDPSKSIKQWNLLHDYLMFSGADIKYISPSMNQPDMVFTANAGLVRDNTVVLSNFKNKERQGEKPYYKEWFLKKGYRVVELPEDVFFEGAGDAIFYENTLFMGYGFRTSLKSHKLVASVFGVDYVSCELVDPYFYHLDTCFLSLGNILVYYKDAFSKKSITRILEKVVKTVKPESTLRLITITSEQASQFACNSVDIGPNILTPADDCEHIFYDYNVIKCDMSEFIKAGGAVKCLTLKL